MVSDWIKSTAIFVVATGLLLSGYLLAWYPSHIGELIELNMSQGGLTPAEIYNLEGSLSWWNTQGTFLYGSISTLMYTWGFLFIVLGIIYSVVTTWRGLSGPKEIPSKYSPQTEPAEHRPSNIQYEKRRQIVKTGFPIAAGILAIISSSLIMVFSGLFVATAVLNFSEYSSQWVTSMSNGILGIAIFGFALAGGVMTLKRKNFILALIGTCFMIVESAIFMVVTGGLAGIYAGIVVFALSVLSLIFTSISYKEFS
jgi:MFS family permease